METPLTLANISNHIEEHAALYSIDDDVEEDEDENDEGG
jgi:hypothetical protein|tara:strand:- start:22 stop:138 length:117 start_codon:yes stop_codon:yes gene_type:complete